MIAPFQVMAQGCASRTQELDNALQEGWSDGGKFVHRREPPLVLASQVSTSHAAAMLVVDKVGSTSTLIRREN